MSGGRELAPDVGWEGGVGSLPAEHIRVTLGWLDTEGTGPGRAPRPLEAQRASPGSCCPDPCCRDYLLESVCISAAAAANQGAALDACLGGPSVHPGCLFP